MASQRCEPAQEKEMKDFPHLVPSRQILGALSIPWEQGRVKGCPAPAGDVSPCAKSRRIDIRTSCLLLKGHSCCTDCALGGLIWE